MKTRIGEVHAGKTNGVATGTPELHCEKGGEFATRLASMLNAALAKSDADGVGRKLIARKLGVEVRTVHTWAAPSHATAITSARLVEMLVRDDVLSQSARRQLLSDIATLAGFSVCDESEDDDQDLAAQVTEVTAALGKVAEEVRTSSDPRGAAGRKIAPEEAERIDDAAGEVMAQASQIRRAVRSGGAGRRA